MTYYEPTTNEPHPGSRLSVSFEQPPVVIPNTSETAMRSLRGPRSRVILEGDAELVERLTDAMAETLAEIRAEIDD